MRRGTRPSLFLTLAVAVAACSVDAGIETRRVDDLPGGQATTTSQPPPPTAPDPPAADSAEPGRSSVPEEVGDADGRPPELGVGDELFPALGSSDVDVVSYLVRLDVREGLDSIDGVVEVVARVPPGVNGLALDAVGVQVEEATVDGEPASTEQSATDVVISLPSDHDGEVIAVIDYSVVPRATDSGTGLPGGWLVAGDSSIVLNQPDRARSWLPSNDHPSDKATWRFEVLAPPGASVSANGDLVRRGGDDTPWIWVEPDPMPTFLVHLLIGDYEFVDGRVTATDGDLPLTSALPSGSGTTFDHVLASIEPQVRFFEEHFGPFPLSKYGVALAPSPPGLAMETQGRTLLSERDFTTPSDFTELLLSHELAHSWFGNAVSPAEWQDIWLSESFATYAQWMWFDHDGRTPLAQTADEVLRARQRPDSPTGAPGRGDMFGFTSYDGGAAVVHALRLTLGDDAFFELMRRWVAENTGASATTEDFIALAEDVHGADLTQFFDDWLFAPSLPPSYPG